MHSHTSAWRPIGAASLALSGFAITLDHFLELPFACGLFLVVPLGFFPDRSVGFLIERRAARGELAEFVVLRPHQRRAIAECAANPLSVKLAVLRKVPGKIGLRQRRTTDSDESDMPVGSVGSGSLE